MMDHLIEIVFKDVPIEETGLLLKDLSSNGQEINNYHFTCECPVINFSNENLTKEVFLKNQDFGLFINLKKLKRNQFSLKNCGIAVYKYKDKVDVEINFKLFDLEECSIKELTNNLMKMAKSIATLYRIDLYFCGIEPAEDVSTRLFTKEEFGPFSIG